MRLATILCVGPPPTDDPEEFDATVRRLHTIAAAAVAQHGGRIVSAEAGDLVLAFGLSGAQEDEAGRALAVADAILAAEPSARLGRAGGRVVYDPGPPVRLSGEARARAAALMAGAAPGRVEVDTITRIRPRPEPAFVGRGRELDQLRALARGVAVGGPAQWCWSAASPGSARRGL